MRTPVKVLFAAFAVGLLAMPAWAQDSAQMTLQDAINGYESVTNGHAGLPEDWSTHHVIFSQPVPGTATYDKVVHDPRYWAQQIRRIQMQSDASVANDVQADDSAAGWDSSSKKKKKNKKPKKIPLKGDWSVSLGGSTATVGAGDYPSKFNFFPSAASCSDFAVFNTSLPGTSATLAGTQATIIAFNNLYASCTGSPPSVLWSYNTGNGSTTAVVTNSVVMSADGKQVAFILSNSTGASLEVLRPVAGQGTSAIAPVLPGTVTTTPATYVSCKTGAGSCLLSLAFVNTTAANDTNSSPFYLYGGTQADTLYVGDDTGHLHKFTGVFAGTPAETHTGTTPFATTPDGLQLTGPVFDTSTSNTFVGEVRGAAGTGLFYNISSAGVVTSSSNVAHAPGWVDAPIVDSGAAKVYAFTGNDDVGTDHSGVFEYPTNFTNATTPLEATVGTASGGTIPLYSGTFDNAYFVSSNSTPTTPTGGLWVCGNTGAAPILYKITITNGNIVGNGAAEQTLASGAATCSPVTEFFNTTDFGFLSVTALGTVSVSPTCTGACVYSFNLGTFAPISGKASTGGASGIIIDNSQSSPGGSEIYYSPLTGDAAVQASQSSLQ